MPYLLNGGQYFLPLFCPTTHKAIKVVIVVFIVIKHTKKKAFSKRSFYYYLEAFKCNSTLIPNLLDKVDNIGEEIERVKRASKL